MVKFGIPSLVEVPEIEDAAALCRDLGLTFLELNTNFPNQQPHLLDPEKLRDIAKKNGIFYTIHLNDEMPVADFSPAVARGYREAVGECIDLAKAIGAPKLNMHISEGAHYTMPDQIVYFYDAYRREYLAGMDAFRDFCEKRIGSSKITICMENSKAYRDYQKEALMHLLESPVFSLTLDVGHNHCSGYADEDWILQNRLSHMHLHDALDEKRDHQPLGTGKINIEKYLKIAGDADCTVVLETKTAEGLRESVRWLKKRI